MSDFGTAATAIATVLLGGATVWLGWTTRSAVHESVRSRLDTGAPKIAVLLDEPDWPPYTTSGSFGVDIQGLGHMMNQRLDSKQYETLSVLVVANGTLINEGRSLAVIALDPAETDHNHLDFFDYGNIVCPRHDIPAPAMTVTPDPGRPPGPRPLGDGRYALPAGERAQFRLQVGMTASDWFSAFERRELNANAGKVTLTITVSGQLAEGPLDEITMGIRAFPIRPREQSDGWFIPGRAWFPGRAVPTPLRGNRSWSPRNASIQGSNGGGGESAYRSPLDGQGHDGTTRRLHALGPFYRRARRRGP